MADEHPKVTHLGGSQRIGDTFALGLDRFTTGAGVGEKVLWRFYISKYCGGTDAFVQTDASLPMLREMQRWAERAIETIQTDGGRKTGERA